MMRRLLIALSVLPLLGAAALADSDPAADYQKADKALNQAFRQIEHRMADDASGKAQLVKAQKAWIAFRDAECSFQSSAVDGGSATPLVIASCKATLTADRVKQLDHYLNCEEGDLSCPVPRQ